MSPEGVQPQGRALSHDQLFKSLLDRFLPEFVQLFLPDLALRLDMGTVKFLQQELVGDHGKVVDLLAEMKLAATGDPVLVHVEVQANREREFARRMFSYYARITERYPYPVAPIALYLFEPTFSELSASQELCRNARQLESWVDNRIGIETLRYTFYAIHLSRVGWRQLAGIRNPVALALLGVAGRRLNDSNARVQVTVEFYRALIQAVVEPQDRQLLAGFFEAYMQLSGEERQCAWKVLESLFPREAEAVEEIWTPLHEMGRAEGYLEVVLRLVRKRLGQVPPDIESSVRTLPPDKVLDLADALFEIGTIEQLQAWLAAKA
ncbi:MAG: DUF4351 domain-containing protein [Limnochordales bacterium]|nr:DUF4351 domain-containing protein [Limnochordales bacterium]